MAKSRTEKSHDVTFAKGGNAHMFGKQAANPEKAGTTAKSPGAAPGAKFAAGGKGKMFGFAGSQPVQAGKTSAR